MTFHPYALCIQSLNVGLTHGKLLIIFVPVRNTCSSVTAPRCTARALHCVSNGPVHPSRLKQVWRQSSPLLGLLSCALPAGLAAGEAPCATRDDTLGTSWEGGLPLPSGLSLPPSPRGYESLKWIHIYMHGCVLGCPPGNHLALPSAVVVWPHQTQRPLGEEHSQCQEAAQQLESGCAGTVKPTSVTIHGALHQPCHHPC